MTQVTVRAPTFSRYRAHLFGNKSLSVLRALEYERLESLGLTGRVLDFGGGKRANYADRINSWGDPVQGYAYESANVDPQMEPTHLIDETGIIPVGDNQYDRVISLNTLEHVYGLAGALSEIRRVLKSGGQLTMIVPFIFRVHGHPDDYTRGTPSFWTRVLSDHGFDDIDIEALTWGPFSTGYVVSGAAGPIKTLRKELLLILDVFYFRLRHGRQMVLRAPQDAPVCSTPFAFLIEAR